MAIKIRARIRDAEVRIPRAAQKVERLCFLCVVPMDDGYVRTPVVRAHNIRQALEMCLNEMGADPTSIQQVGDV